MGDFSLYCQCIWCRYVGYCRAVSDLTTLSQVPGTPVAISGWAWMGEDQQQPGTIIVVDASECIVGAAPAQVPVPRNG